jgi:hypothetical protein
MEGVDTRTAACPLPPSYRFAVTPPDFPVSNALTPAVAESAGGATLGRPSLMRAVALRGRGDFSLGNAPVVDEASRLTT